MKVNPINNNNQRSFGALKCVDSAITKDLFKSIMKTPAFDTFANKYDASLSLERVACKQNPKVSQIAFVFTSIKPATLLGKISKFFSSQRETSVMLKTHATNEEEILSSIMKRDRNCLLKLVDKKNSGML